MTAVYLIGVRLIGPCSSYYYLRTILSPRSDVPGHPDCRVLYLVDISKAVHDISAKP